jgi:steroid delta-isomerase-like uncharacterized protein
MPSDAERDAERNERRVARVREHMRLENAHEFPACIAVFDRPRYTFVATGEVHDGASGVESLLLENRRAFPDFRFEPVRVSAGGDIVLAEGVFTGTHDGPWRGLPATGRSVRLEMAVVFEFEGENLVCERVYFNLGTILRQLGVARDPNSLSGRLSTMVGHPLTIGRAFLRSLLPRRRKPD